MAGQNPISYPDLEWETQQILEAAADRLDEKDAEYGGPGWRGSDPRYHLYHAMRNLGDVADATDGTPDYDEIVRQSGDVLNHLAMALTNVETGKEE